MLLLEKQLMSQVRQRTEILFTPTIHPLLRFLFMNLTRLKIVGVGIGTITMVVMEAGPVAGTMEDRNSEKHLPNHRLRVGV